MKTLEKVDYYGWPNSYRLSNGAIELIATSDVGPGLITSALLAERMNSQLRLI